MTLSETLRTAAANGLTPSIDGSLFSMPSDQVFQGQNKLPETVVIQNTDTARLAEFLCIFDGQVDILVLLSSTFTDDEIRRVCLNFDDYLLVSDQESDIEGWTPENQFINFMRNPPKETRWVIATSGTTSEPKLVSHSFKSASKSTKSDIGLSKLVWGLLYDPARYAGLQVLLQALCSGAALIAPSSNLSLGERTEILRDNGVTALSATPSLWRKMVLSGVLDNWDLKIVTMGGEIADQKTISALIAKFPNAEIRHIYASTEAGTGFSVNDKKSGFPASYIEHPPTGISLKVIDNVLYIKNQLVEPNYLGSDDKFADIEGFVDTGDVVLLENNRYYFCGRNSGVINVGGNKVFPESVADILSECTDVIEMRVFGIESSIVGQLVHADVVIDNNDERAVKLATDKLRSIANERLKNYERPVKYNFVDEIKVTDNGKVLRK